MKRNIMILLFSLFAFSISAQSLTQQAAAAYNADKYSEAIELYNRVLHEEGVSSDLYYNLGNCYYKSGLLGKAVLCYERALLYNPNNEDALIWRLSIQNWRTRLWTMKISCMCFFKEL